MKVGDLVKFESTFFSASAKTYANPGVILSELTPGAGKWRSPRRSFRVVWADMRTTVEHQSFLKLLTSS